MKNKLGFLGLLGFIGILGIVTENRYFLAFFCYFVFFRYFFVKPDELFQSYVKKAATPAFFTGLAFQALTISAAAFTKNTQQLISGFLLGFAASTIVFILVLVISEFSESRNR
jgi:TRAP-type C4-dicarboxylate transport system permease large subunit